MDLQHVLRGFQDTTEKLFATRDMVEAKLISTPPYIVLSNCEMYLRYPATVRAIDERCTREEIGLAARRPGGQLNQRWLWTMGTLFLWGRQFLIQMGEIEPDSGREDVELVLGFVRDVSRAYRGDCAWIGVENDGGTVPSLDRELVEQIEADLITADPGPLSRVKRLNALLTTYTFLMGAESRKGMHAHGPYPVGPVTSEECWGFTATRRLWVKEFNDLGVNRYSYSDTAAGVEIDKVVIAVVLDGVVAAVPPWGTHLITEPADYLDRVVSFAIYEATEDGLRGLGEDETETLFAQLTEAQVNLYMRMAEWTRAEAQRAGTECYFKGNIEPVAAFAGVADDFDFMPGELTDRLLEEMSDEKAAALLGSLTSEHWQ